MTDDDRRQRNGPAPLVVPMPTQHEQRPPIRPLGTTWRTEQEWQRLLTNKVMEVIPAVNGQSEQLADNTAQTIVLTRAVNKLAEIVQGHPRDPDQSFHEFDPAVLALRETLKSRERDKTNFDGRTATALVEEFDKALKERRELAVWRAIKSVLRGVSWEVAKYFLPGAIFGGAVYLWHWLTTHH